MVFSHFGNQPLLFSTGGAVIEQRMLYPVVVLGGAMSSAPWYQGLTLFLMRELSEFFLKLSSIDVYFIPFCNLQQIQERIPFPTSETWKSRMRIFSILLI